MSSKRKESKVDDLAEKATCFFVKREPNPAAKVKVTEAMRVEGYSDCGMPLLQDSHLANIQ
jgi:hypothetical protein